MNFTRDVVHAAPAERAALVELPRAGERRKWIFGELADASARLAGRFAAEGVNPGDAVLVWVGNRVEWVVAMLACFRMGAVPASCPEQLRARDLRLRLDVASPRGSIVVLREGYAASDELVRELQGHVKAETAPYKYPRRIDFVSALPKTASGKIRRAELR